jgi:hypothetical protein
LSSQKNLVGDHVLDSSIGQLMVVLSLMAGSSGVMAS